MHLCQTTTLLKYFNIYSAFYIVSNPRAHLQEDRLPEDETSVSKHVEDILKIEIF